MSASMVTLKTLDNWDKQIAAPLHNAMQAVIELTGRTGRQACEMAMVYMARSASKMTRQARKNRKIRHDEHGKFVLVTEGSPHPKPFYDWMFDTDKPDAITAFTWEDVRRVRSRGLAKRSWFWGISGLNKAAAAKSKKMNGVADVQEFVKPNSAGLILTNRLSYIDKVAPANVQQQAARKASDQIMAQMAKKVEKRWKVESQRIKAGKQKRAAKKLAREFKKAKGRAGNKVAI